MTTSAQRPKTTVSSSSVVNVRYRSHGYQYKNRKRRDMTAEGRITVEEANEATQNDTKKTIGNSVGDKYWGWREECSMTKRESGLSLLRSRGVEPQLKPSIDLIAGGCLSEGKTCRKWRQ